MAEALTHDRLRSELDGTRIWRPAEHELCPAVRHRETRDFITTIGIPDGWADGFYLEDRFREGDAWTPGDLFGDLYALASLGDHVVLLDGETGLLWTVAQWSRDEVRPLHRGVAALVTYMYEIYRARPSYRAERFESIDRDPGDPRDYVDAAEDAALTLAITLHEIDPTPFTPGWTRETNPFNEVITPESTPFAGAWTQILMDIGGGQWSE